MVCHCLLKYKLFEQKVAYHDNAQRNAVPAEYLKVVFFNVSHQELDGEYRDDKGDDHAGEKDGNFAAGKVKTEFDDL